MDKKLANNLVVGVFVLGGLLAFLFVLFSIGDGRGMFSSQYVLYGRFTNVKGLHTGSEVALAGLRIGVVRAIKVSQEKAQELIVEMAVAKSYQDRIRTDSVALVRTQGMLGDKFIEISIGSPNLDTLKNKDFITSGEQADLFTKSGNLVEGLSKQFDKGGDVDALVKNLNRVAINLAQITSQVQYGNSGTKLSSSLEQLDGILRKINNGEGTLGLLVNDPTLYEDMKYLMGGAKRSNVLKYFMRSFMESGEKSDNKK